MFRISTFLNAKMNNFCDRAVDTVNEQFSINKDIKDKNITVK